MTTIFFILRCNIQIIYVYCVCKKIYLLQATPCFQLRHKDNSKKLAIQIICGKIYIKNMYIEIFNTNRGNYMNSLLVSC